MTSRMWLLFLAPTALLTGCIKAPTALKCLAPAALIQTSVNGDTITLNTGLRYLRDVPGDGPALVWCGTVAIQYDAYLLDGTKFDTSRLTGTPLVFTTGLGSLIDGIEQGVVGMRVGGTRRLIISPALGFGAAARTNSAGVVIVPANSTVIYDIEVMTVAQ